MFFFKIYYEDGTRIGSWEIPRGTGEDVKTKSFSGGSGIPPRGIVAITQGEENDLTTLFGYDYYVFWKGIWVGANYYQLLDYLIDLDRLKLDQRGIRVNNGKKWVLVDDIQFKRMIDDFDFVLTGRNVFGKRLEDILEEAIDDPEVEERTKLNTTIPNVSLVGPGFRKKRYKNEFR